MKQYGNKRVKTGKREFSLPDPYPYPLAKCVPDPYPTRRYGYTRRALDLTYLIGQVHNH